MNLRVDPEGVTGILRQLRTAAELVRTFGGGIADPKAGINVAVPGGLYVVAAALESRVRAFMAVDCHMQGSIIERMEPESVEPLETIEFRPESVPTFVIHPAPDASTCSAQLQESATMIGEQARLLRLFSIPTERRLTSMN